MPDIMVDLETTGVDAGDCAIIQIAAVKFNLETGEVGDMFDQALSIPAGRYWEEQCRDWWLKDKREVLMSIFKRMRDPMTVLQEFQQWVMAGWDSTMEPVRFWSKPTHFDFTFLQGYFKQFDIINPFHYRHANDMNSFIRARYFPELAPNWELDLPFEGPQHQALFDALHQIKVLFKVYGDTKHV